ncbi:SMP-30/gluconolactonase/LRE family protein [Actinophytocola algeriensis]|uniref:Sugar lactone lactonase YvrE n=1 Tax=Actinophytocola algeriensis TaxID=1768010 RepID=A0A7W7Q714_9PSEU|nr:SMP-30/gluconolactonase/LRE family protein [Actinophytocola algeriensis]MBB4908225.1 sugar lactone lactonase YvrE [Actinophytocola algeriensis]MBE1480255.1 sugar lactone lactonase YvrE [Actinophytocola algeriensis]
MFRRVGVVLAALLVITPAVAAASPAFPTTIDLPNGFQPEGIAIGPGPVAYFGSLADGRIYRADLRTGRGRVISEGPGTPSVGLKTDQKGRLYVAGGAAGNARVIDTRTGEVLASYQLTTAAAFVNDVALAGGSAWFTDSVNQQLYRLTGGTATTVPITGDLVYGEGFNANGIAPTPDGKALLVVQSNTGKLFRVGFDGRSTLVALDYPLTNGDGLLLSGRTLYVVQNRLNTVAVLHLDRHATRAVLKKTLTDERFDVPTTVAAFGNRLYLPNARFGTTPGPDVEYQVIAIRR